MESDKMVDQDDMGTHLLSSEIRNAIKEILDKRESGIDELRHCQQNFFKNLDGQIRKELERLCVNTSESGNWPEDFLRTIMIPIPKGKKTMPQSALVSSQ